ncbi:MAG: lysophospholipid acyltransferase family protein [bacterium]
MTPDSLQPETEIRQPTYDEFKKNRPVWTTSLRRGVEYAVFRFGLFLGKKLSLPQLQKMGRGVGSFGYKVLHKDRGIVEKQLELIFPELDAAQRKQWTQECFAHFGQMLFEFLSLPQILRDEADLLEVENEEALTKAIQAEKGVILLAMHSGNWELISAYAKRSGLKMKAATTNFPDPRINELIESQREHGNMEILRRGTSTAIRKLLSCLREKEVLVLAIDQDTNVLSTWVPFFGIPAKTPVGAAVFALKTGASVVSYNVIRQPNGTFRMRFETLGNFVRQHPEMEQDVYSVTRKMNLHLEQRIREHPQQWAWFHRRWRHRPVEEELKKMKELEQNEIQSSAGRTEKQKSTN